jgi:acyl-CoA synthetase (AMP-forming)/AMP-acid ligase II
MENDVEDPSYRKPVLHEELATFAELLAAAADQFPGTEAYVHRGQRITYREWYERALRLGFALQDRRVGVGDVVLIGIESSIDFAVCFAAAQIIGAIASGVNTRLGRREIAAIVEKTQAPLMILEDDAEVPPGTQKIIRRAEIESLCQLSPKAEPYAGLASELAVIIWTSGTTGLPKGACFAHENLASAIQTAGPMAAPFARKLSSVPFAHAGYMAKGWEQVAFGMTLIISDTPWSADDMLRLLVDERINIAGAVPTQWAKFIDHPGLSSADLSRVKIGITATAPAPPELIERVTEAIAAPLIVRYSMTECPSMTGTRVGDSAEVQYRSVGRAQPQTQLKLVDMDDGKVGRIAVRAPCMMRGYWRDPERTDEAIQDGWLISSDLGRFDKDGNLILAGRMGEMYIRGGYNIYPLEVERVLSELPSVGAVAIIGVPAPKIGEIGVAFVVATDTAAPPTLEDLRTKVRLELADYKAPDRLVLVRALPLTPMMKVDKAALKLMSYT